MREHTRGERLRDPLPGLRAARVDDPPPRMPAFEAEPGVELDSEVDEICDARGRFGGQRGDRARSRQAPAAADRVLRMPPRVVVLPDCGCHPALGEAARRGSEWPLGKKKHVGVVGRAESRVQAGHAATDDDQVCRISLHSLGRCARFTTVSQKPAGKSTRVSASGSKTVRPSPTHVTLAVVLRVRAGHVEVLLWQRGKEPFAGAWALPGGYLDPAETLERSIRRQLANKVDVRELAHLEQLETRSDPQRHPAEWQLATAYLGLVPTDADPALPADTAWHRVDRLPELAFDHGAIALAGRERLRAKLSYTNLGFALAPATFTISELRDLYGAALGHDVSATNLQRVLLRRGVLEPTGGLRSPGPTGGRPAALYRFRTRRLEITDQFAVLRPPGR